MDVKVIDTTKITYYTKQPPRSAIPYKSVVKEFKLKKAIEENREIHAYELARYKYYLILSPLRLTPDEIQMLNEYLGPHESIQHFSRIRTYVVKQNKSYQMKLDDEVLSYLEATTFLLWAKLTVDISEGKGGVYTGDILFLRGDTIPLTPINPT